MYNGHEYLSCIKIPATKQVTMKNTDRPEKVEPMDLVADYRDLISTANKVFGEGKWNHTVVNQSLGRYMEGGGVQKISTEHCATFQIYASNYVEVVGAKCHVGCVTHVKVQLETGNFHQDIGYYYAEESTKGLSVHNARIGSAINALKRVLLSFGNKIDKELQQLEKQISSEQVNGVRTSVTRPLDKQIPEKSISNKVSTNEKQANNIQRNLSGSLDKQIPEKSSNSIQLPSKKEQENDIQKGVIQLADEPISEKSNLSYLLASPFSLDNKVIVQSIKVGPKDNNLQRTVTRSLDKQISEKSISNKVPSDEEQANNVQRNVSRSSDKQIPEKFSNCQLISNKEQENNIQKDSTATMNIKTARLKLTPCDKIVEASPNKETNSPTKQKSNQALSAQEMQRLERKRKQKEKQMEFKRRMMEKEGLKKESIDDNKKPNPKY
ncbi:uncharacterized protein LOC105835879 isoform X4 [Monomorium pharaonis]|uniref:uncharacterized protein LOC105835879 isoform X4 n=1 Tax=Monomorium pharaonis TaxID=307658 RepID=UPI001746F773|nr:uncharacterized protein LOC105835879 isoform X4 [Monomorium pharaonis]